MSLNWHGLRLGVDPDAVPRLQLLDGHLIPQVGLGLYKTPPGLVPGIVRDALRLGYRCFDTATMYGNEQALGQSLASSGIPRDQVFLSTKLWNTDHEHDRAVAACHRSLELLGTEYLDLYLIHWPAPRQDRYLEAWQALESLQAEGLVRSIGVCNFHRPHLDRLAQHSATTPSVNQIECHPWLQQHELSELHRIRGITTQAWSPLARGRVGQDEGLRALADRLGRSVAQIALRWQIQRGVVVIPKTVNPERLADNIGLFDFELDEEALHSLAGMNTGDRTGTHPDDRD